MVALPSNGSRLAAIDIGTNSILLTIAAWEAGKPNILVDRATTTRLGERVDGSRQLAPQAIERSLECLRQYAEVIAAHDVVAIDAVGTSALRDAQCSSDFLERATALLGVRPRIIDGAEEADLTCLGALSGLDVEGPFLVVDIGGGSTEIISGSCRRAHVEVEDSISLDVGSVRLTERHVMHDPPTLAELDAITCSVDAALRRVPFDTTRGTLVGVAGTITTLCAIDLGLASYDPSRVHGATLELSSIEQQLETLAHVPRHRRMTISGLEPSRADIIVAGTLIITKLLRWSGRTSLVVSDRGVRYGLLSKLFSKYPTNRES